MEWGPHELLRIDDINNNATIIAGLNNCGKSAILLALEFAFTIPKYMENGCPTSLDVVPESIRKRLLYIIKRAHQKFGITLPTDERQQRRSMHSPQAHVKILSDSGNIYVLDVIISVLFLGSVDAPLITSRYELLAAKSSTGTIPDNAIISSDELSVLLQLLKLSSPVFIDEHCPVFSTIDDAVDPLIKEYEMVKKTEEDALYDLNKCFKEYMQVTIHINSRNRMREKLISDYNGNIAKAEHAARMMGKNLSLYAHADARYLVQKGVIDTSNPSQLGSAFQHLLNVIVAALKLSVSSHIRLLVLDEPDRSLDRASHRALGAMLSRFAQSGLQLFMATHSRLVIDSGAYCANNQVKFLTGNGVLNGDVDNMLLNLDGFKPHEMSSLLKFLVKDRSDVSVVVVENTSDETFIRAAIDGYIQNKSDAEKLQNSLFFLSYRTRVVKKGIQDLQDIINQLCSTSSRSEQSKRCHLFIFIDQDIKHDDILAEESKSYENVIPYHRWNRRSIENYLFCNLDALDEVWKFCELKGRKPSEVLRDESIIVDVVRQLYKLSNDKILEKCKSKKIDDKSSVNRGISDWMRLNINDSSAISDAALAVLEKAARAEVIESMVQEMAENDLKKWRADRGLPDDQTKFGRHLNSVLSFINGHDVVAILRRECGGFDLTDKKLITKLFSSEMYRSTTAVSVEFGSVFAKLMQHTGINRQSEPSRAQCQRTSRNKGKQKAQ